MSRRPLIVRALCLATLLALGFQIVYAVVVVWVVAVGFGLFPSRDPYEYLSFLGDGTPFIATYTPADYHSRTARTLDGELLTPEDLETQTGRLTLQGPHSQPRVRTGWDGRIRSFNDGRDPPIYWYFVHTGERNGHGHFVGYDSKLKLCVGYIGAAGFSRDEPPPEQSFPVNGPRIAVGMDIVSPSSRYYHYGPGVPYHVSTPEHHEPIKPWLAYLVSSDRVLEIDLRERSVRTVIESDAILSIGVSQRLFPIPKEEESMRPVHRRLYLAIRLPDRVQVIDPRGDERRVYFLPDELQTRDLGFIERNDGTAILQSQPGPTHSPVDLYWVSSWEGTVRSETIVLKGSFGIPLLSLGNVYLYVPFGIRDPRAISGLSSLLSPVPAAWIVAGTVGVPVAYVMSGEVPDYPSALAESLWDTWPGILISVVLSAWATWVCLKRQRRFAAGWTRTWAIFVFLFGIPGLLGYLFCRSWPPQEECPACQEQVPRDRECCSRCHADFPEPAPKGIEVVA